MSELSAYWITPSLSTMNAVKLRDATRRQLDDLAVQVEQFMEVPFKEARKAAKDSAKDDVKLIKQTHKSCLASIKAEDLKTARDQFQSMQSIYKGLMLHGEGNTPLQGLESFDKDWRAFLQSIRHFAQFTVSPKKPLPTLPSQRAGRSATGNKAGPRLGSPRARTGNSPRAGGSELSQSGNSSR